MIELPPWATAADLEDAESRYFLSYFRDRAHWLNYLATGDLRRPESIRRAEKIAADPIATQREVLRKRVSYDRRAIRDAEDKIARAAEELKEPFGYHHWRAQETVKQQTVRLEERRRALAGAEVELELFQLEHQQ